MSIVENRKARFNYTIEDTFEAGLVLQGWEVKAIREGRAQIAEGYVIVREGELFLIGCQITPLLSASTHVSPEAARTKKLLMHKGEINRLIGKVEQKGYTLIPLNLHYNKGRVKLDFGLAKGKKTHDKRQTEKDRDWQREKTRIMHHNTKRGDH
ncbi:MAG: SsrA-binding protein SmpB [Saezia sp.]